MSDEMFFRKWLEGEMPDDEISRHGRKAFDDENEWAAFRKIIDNSRDLKPPVNKTMEDSWNDLVNKIESRPQPVIRENVTRPFYQRKIVKYLSIAASILIAFALYAVFLANKPTIYTTAKSEIKTITMPDNSVVTLNAESTLSFVKGNWMDNRSVSLEGEAFFDVKKGTKFEVNSEVGKVTVLGTTFNIKARNTHFEVSCFTGKVAVSLLNHPSEKVLSEGLATKIINQKLTDPFDFKRQNTVGWRYGEYYFEKQQLTEVFEEFERQFNVRLKVNADIGSRVYSGYFSKTDMESALELICLPMNLEFEIQDNKTIVIFE